MPDPGPFVVDFDPGLYGPFDTREQATEWATGYVNRLTTRFLGNVTYSWCVVPVRPATVPYPGEKGRHDTRTGPPR